MFPFHLTNPPRQSSRKCRQRCGRFLCTKPENWATRSLIQCDQHKSKPSKITFKFAGRWKKSVFTAYYLQKPIDLALVEGIGMDRSNAKIGEELDKAAYSQGCTCAQLIHRYPLICFGANAHTHRNTNVSIDWSMQSDHYHQ